MTRTRRSSTTSSTDERSAGQILGAWLGFTLARDTTPHLVVNWLFGPAFIGATYLLWRQHWLALLIVLVVALAYSAGRAARHIPARRKAHTKLYEATKRQCGHPTLTRSSNTTAASYVPIRKWRGTKPVAGTIRYTPNSMASKTGTRALVERTIDQTLAPPKGQSWAFDHTNPSEFSFLAVPADDVRVVQRSTRGWIDQTADKMFPKAGDALDVTIDWDQTQPKHPASVTIEFGAESLDRADRERLELHFDGNVQRPGIEWLYEWEPGLLQVTAADPDSDDAQQKRVEREVSAMTLSTLGSLSRSATTAVTKWLDNTPAAVSVELTKGKFTTGSEQRRIAGPILAQLASRWPDRAWIPHWTIGPTTTLAIDAVPHTSVPALQHAATARFITAMETVMKVDRAGVPPELTITEWRTDTDEDTDKVTAVAPAKMEIDLGSFVASNDAQMKVEEAFDRLSLDTGFRFEWDLHEDRLRMTEFPALPSYVWFPDRGTEEFRRQEALARRGILTLGPAKGGGYFEAKLSDVPHWLTGGITGSGKSVILTIGLFWALWLPDVYDVIVIDPKRTDFTWTEEFPNVRFFCTPKEINGATRYIYEEMGRRQDLLRKYGVEKVSFLHSMDREGKVSDPIPRRMLVIFDEMGSYFNPSTNEETQVLQGESKENMEQITMLSRATDINVWGAAQKPNKDSPGTKIRDQMGGRCGVCYMDPFTSSMVLGDARASKVDRARTPPGRAWGLAQGSPDVVFQAFYLPKRNEKVEWADGEWREGVIDMVRDRLIQTSWVQTTVTNDAGGTEKRWVRSEMVDPDTPPAG